MIRHLRRGGPTPLTATPEQGAQDKLRLFLTIAHATAKLAQQSPMLVVVDDLHWADQPSLDLFTYLGFVLADQPSVPLLLLGTYRPLEQDSRLSRLVKRFEREQIYSALDLPGLGNRQKQSPDLYSLK